MISLQFNGNDRRKVFIKVLGKKEQADFDPGWNQADRNYYYDDLIRKHCPHNKIFRLNQVHGDTFFSTEELEVSNTVQNGDALIAREPGRVLLIRTADCIPIFFWSETENFFGVIHSGWKGLQLDITGKLLNHLKKKGADLSKVIFYIGPSIGKNNYEIQEDVASNFPDATDYSLSKKENGYLFGPSLYLIESLIRNNFPVKIHQSGICTKVDPDFFSHCSKVVPDFFSHRGGDTGRNLNLIYVNE
ncbi:MAG: polyphenol oxidase family protein [Leptospira sp.]|nr:polyphenol oxidase family protein [Leptospira sp.]